MSAAETIWKPRVVEPASGARLAAAYGAMVLLPLAVLGGILHFGSATVADGGRAAAPAIATGAGGFSIPLLLTQVGVILTLSRAMGWALARMGQPRVIGEMLAGILLGPSFFGLVAPKAAVWLFPAQGFVGLNALSQLGLVLFMFLVGMELNLGEARQHWRLAMLSSHASISAPMTAGAALAVFLYPRMSDPSVGFTGFALFIGVSMSITAFPVLARILRERGLMGTQLGAIAIACAAVDDATGWCVLAGVVGVARASHGAIPLWAPVAGLPCFVALMVFGARPLLMRWVDRDFAKRSALSDERKALVLAMLLASALATEWIGVHLLFGAFVLGAVMPKRPGLAAYVSQQFESLTVLLLLPLFFAYTGLRTRIGEIGGAAEWSVCLLIIGVAVAGKLGGTGVAARLGGLRWRDALAVGALMNTRGLMELVVLNIGLEVGLISPKLFSMLVLMAMATTMMTSPLVSWLGPVRFAPGSPGVWDYTEMGGGARSEGSENQGGKNL